MSDALLTVLLVALVCGTSAEVTYLMTQSRITEPPRAALQKWFERRWADSHGLSYEEVDVSEVWVSQRAYLLSCSWCSGVWYSGAVTLVVALTEGLPWPWLVWGGAAYVAGRWGGERGT